MADQTLLEAVKLAAVSLFSGGIAIIGFAGKYQKKGEYQTKADCATAHIEYEKLQKSRRETQEAKLSSVHSSVQRIEVLVNKMANDMYEPRSSRTRTGD
jgi:hypothetical protein